MKLNIEARTARVPAKGLPAGTIVPILDTPYELINDVELKGWV